MTIIEDVNQKAGQHKNVSEFCENEGIVLRRQKLNCGDYQLAPPVSVDTKKGLQEIYSDIVSDHERFRNECIRANTDGTRLVMLIENTDGLTCLEDVAGWRNPRYVEWEEKNRFLIDAHKAGRMLNTKLPASPVTSERLMKMMDAMTMKYGVEWQFCRPEETGQAIVDILTGKR